MIFYQIRYTDLEFNSEGNYLPILYFNDYWNLNKDYHPINDTTKLDRIAFLPVQ